MRAIVRLAGAGLIPAMLACGSDASMSASGAPDDGGGAGAAGAAGKGGAEAGAGKSGRAGAGGVSAALTPKGSLELHLSTLGKAGAKSKPSPSAVIRVDLPGVGDAIVTPRWGAPSVFHVAEKSGALLLTGSATVRVGDTTDVWQSFALELDAARKLTGKFSAAGQESVYDGAVGASVAVTASGDVVDDETSPEVKLELSPSFTGGARLPWEGLTLRFSEPIAPAMLAESLHVQAADAPVPVTWSLGPGGGAAGGAVTATGFAQSFDAPTGALTVRALAGYSDAAGNAGAALDAQVDVLKVVTSAALPGELSTGGLTGLTTWGPAAYSASAGALALGPLALGSCDVTPAGVAGRATLAGGATKVEVRYRVVAAPKAPGVSPVSGALPAISLLVATPGAAPASKELLAPALTETTSDGKLASPWVSAIVPVQVAAGGEVGWALRAGALTSSAACTAGPSELSPVTVSVLVDAVSAK